MTKSSALKQIAAIEAKLQNIKTELIALKAANQYQEYQALLARYRALAVQVSHLETALDAIESSEA